MILSQKTRIAQVAGGGCNEIRRKDADGDIVKEKIPGIPFTRKMVSASGNVIRICLANGKTLGGFAADGSPSLDLAENVYGAMVWNDARRKGMLPYAECPYTNGWLDVPEGVTPCEGEHPITQQLPNPNYNHKKPQDHINTPMMTREFRGRGAFWRADERRSNALVEEKCCHHIEEIIARRQAKHSEKQAEFAMQFRTKQDELAEYELARIQEKLADAKSEQ